MPALWWGTECWLSGVCAFCCIPYLHCGGAQSAGLSGAPLNVSFACVVVGYRLLASQVCVYVCVCDVRCGPCLRCGGAQSTCLSGVCVCVCVTFVVVHACVVVGHRVLASQVCELFLL